MYNAERRAQTQALHTPTQHTLTVRVITPAPRRRALTLRMILEAFSWLGEMRAMPFAGLHSGSRPTERQGRDH
jgi:hypothetical protein